MAYTEVRLPALGEGITEATITRWLIKIGDMVTTETALVEIATDKVDSEVISPVEGKVTEILLPEHAVPKIGQILLRIATEQEGESTDQEPASSLPSEMKESRISEENILLPAIETPFITKAERKFISPFVRHLAFSEGISIEELYMIKGNGLDARLTKEDILAHILQRPKKKLSTISKDFEPQQPEVSINSLPPIVNPGEIAIPMDRVRKLIAKNMLESKHKAPHVTVFSEVDITPIVLWRNKNKNIFQKKFNENLTFTPLFIEAVSRALKEFPGINASVKDEYIIQKNNINIGMAVALPDGNLIVPVVKNANQLNLPELATQVNDLAKRSRELKLKPIDIQDGTFTITNIGAFGNISGTPIINLPQVAILAIGTITRKPSAITVEGGTGIGLRDMVTLSLSFDHRVVDGAMGGSFLQRICENLNSFNINRDF